MNISKLKNKIAGEMISQFENATNTSIRDHIEEIRDRDTITFGRYPELTAAECTVRA